MKKLSIFKIVILVIAVLLIATIFYRIFQVKNFQKDLRPITESEQQKVIEILSENMNLTGCEIIFGNVLTDENGRLVQVQIKEGNLKKTYLINLENNNLVRKHDEQ